MPVEHGEVFIGKADVIILTLSDERCELMQEVFEETGEVCGKFGVAICFLDAVAGCGVDGVELLENGVRFQDGGHDEVRLRPRLGGGVVRAWLIAGQAFGEPGHRDSDE